MQDLSKISVVLPSLDPDEKLNAVIDGLLEYGFSNIILVNDGSKQENLHYFTDAAAAHPEIHLIHHEVNRGKGAALKTAFRWFLDNCPEGAGVVTVTGVRPQPDVIGNVACDCRTGEMYASMRPAHPGLFYGTGDVFASALSGLLVRGAPLSDALETATALTDESICRSLWRDTPRHFGVDFEGALPAYIRRVEKIFEA